MRAGRWETLGAWLGVWTPARDVEVPPRPSLRTVLAGLVVAGVVVGGAYALIAPRIDEGKDERSAREQRALDADRDARVRRTRIEQRPRSGRVPAGASRAEVVAALEAAITRDAVARFERGELPSRVRDTRCEPAPVGDGEVLDCLASVRDIVRGGEFGSTPQGRIGYPFRAVVDLRRGRWAFCKVNPPPGEQVIPDPRSVVELPPACRSGE